MAENKKGITLLTLQENGVTYIVEEEMIEVVKNSNYTVGFLYASINDDDIEWFKENVSTYGIDHTRSFVSVASLLGKVILVLIASGMQKEKAEELFTISIADIPKVSLDTIVINAASVKHLISDKEEKENFDNLINAVKNVYSLLTIIDKTNIDANEISGMIQIKDLLDNNIAIEEYYGRTGIVGPYGAIIAEDIDGSVKGLYTHVAIAFATIKQTDPNAICILHKDFNIANNDPDNLEYCTLEDFKVYLVESKKQQLFKDIHNVKVIETEELVFVSDAEILPYELALITALWKFNRPDKIIYASMVANTEKVSNDSCFISDNIDAKVIGKKDNFNVMIEKALEGNANPNAVIYFTLLLEMHKANSYQKTTTDVFYGLDMIEDKSVRNNLTLAQSSNIILGQFKRRGMDSIVGNAETGVKPLID